MKEILFKYIQILLPQHNCIVLPGFGAFILNQKLSDYDETGVLLPPSFYVGFNGKLNHNDGVLVSFHSQVQNISYEKAFSEINIFISQLKFELVKYGGFVCGDLGSFRTEENRLIFKPTTNFVVPFYFGLEPIKLKKIVVSENSEPIYENELKERIIGGGIPVTEIEREISEEYQNEKIVKISFKKQILPYVVAASIALMFFIPFDKVQDAGDYHQNAGFVNSITSLSSNLENDNSSSKILTENNTNKIKTTIGESRESSDENLISPNEKLTSDLIEPILNDKVHAKYYLIVASHPKEEIANSMLSNIRKDGFEDADILESPERFRIHIADFEKKEDADIYMKNLKKNFPKYSSSWIYTKLD